MGDQQGSRFKKLMGVGVVATVLILAFVYRGPVVWAVKFELMGEGTLRDSAGPVTVRYYRNRLSTSPNIVALRLSKDEAVLGTVARDPVDLSDWSIEVGESTDDAWITTLAARAWNVVLDPVALETSLREGGDPRIDFWSE